MKDEVKETIVEIPEGIEINLQNSLVTVKKEDKELSRDFGFTPIKIEKKDNELKLSVFPAKKKNNAALFAVAAHLRNMFNGVDKGYEYKLQAIYSHFPMTIQVKDKIVEINNFAGQKKPRTAKIMGNTKVVVKGKDITVSGMDKEQVGQTAANLELATKIRNKDLRVFQDGIYITYKGLKE